MDQSRQLVAEASSATPADLLLQEILASPNFQRAPALSRLLTYLWEHRAESISEYSIGIDVFGKPAGFDPKFDATIRVHVSRLRQKLRDYSSTAPTRLTLPSGSLKPQVEIVEQVLLQEPVAPANIPTNGSESRYKRLAIVAGVFAAILLVAVAFLFTQLRQLKSSSRQSTAPHRDLPAFWQRALGNGKLTRIIFPTPVFISAGPLRIRDVTVNDPDDLGNSADLRRMLIAANKPVLSHSYSVANDTLGLATLLPVLSNRGLPITVNSTREFSLERFGSDNLIFLGIPPTSKHVARLLANNHFYIGRGSSHIAIRDPSPSESRIPLQNSFTDNRRYGIVAVIPGESPGTHVILLCGLHSEAAAAYLASPLTLRQLEDFLGQQGHPEHFEMLIETEQEGSNLLSAKPVAFRKIIASR